MARPRKSSEEKKQQGTYRKDRDASKKKVDVTDEKYEVIRIKLKEVEGLIKETPVAGNEKKLIEMSNLYQKLVNILQTPSLERKPGGMVDGLWKE
jgi:hypothetical protein